MKNSGEYSRKIQKLYRSLKRKYSKVQKITYEEPVDAIIYAIIGESMSRSAADSAIKKFLDYFTDWNDLRVSRPEEIVELLGGDTPVTRETASRLAAVLACVFDEHNKISLEALKKIGKRPARQALEKMEGTDHFVVNYCMLTALQGHAIPLTENMVEYLRENELVHPEADEQQIEGFLTKRISAKNAYEFYAFLRRESGSRRPRKKTTRKTKTKETVEPKKKTKKAKRKK